MASGHSHTVDEDEIPWPSQATSVRRALVSAPVAFALLALVGLVLWWPSGDALVRADAFGFASRVDGRVTDASIEGGSSPSNHSTGRGRTRACRHS